MPVFCYQVQKCLCELSNELKDTNNMAVCNSNIFIFNAFRKTYLCTALIRDLCDRVPLATRQGEFNKTVKDRT